MKHVLGLLFFIALATSGCLIVDESLLDGLAGEDTPDSDGGMDASTDGGGAVEQLAVDTCSDPNIFTIPGTMANIMIDTRAFGAESTPICSGSSAAQGNDGFLAIEVVAGEKWHFHIRGGPGFETTANPSIYMLQQLGEGCDDRQCEQHSDYCTDDHPTEDEHFAFVATAPGIWYLGIDDRNSGGAVYLLDAFRLDCPNGEKVHGEACDEGGDTATCDDRCRRKVTGDTPNEIVGNTTFLEANRLIVPGDNDMIVRGFIGTACEPDFFAFQIAEDDTDVAVTVVDSAHDLCAEAATAPFTLSLQDATGANIGGGTNGTTGCPEIIAPDLGSGEYTMVLTGNADLFDSQVEYRFRLALTPP